MLASPTRQIILSSHRPKILSHHSPSHLHPHASQLFTSTSHNQMALRSRSMRTPSIKMLDQGIKRTSISLNRKMRELFSNYHLPLIDSQTNSIDQALPRRIVQAISSQRTVTQPAQSPSRARDSRRSSCLNPSKTVRKTMETRMVKVLLKIRHLWPKKGSIEVPRRTSTRNITKRTWNKIRDT